MKISRRTVSVQLVLGATALNLLRLGAEEPQAKAAGFPAVSIGFAAKDLPRRFRIDQNIPIHIEYANETDTPIDLLLSLNDEEMHGFYFAFVRGFYLISDEGMEVQLEHPTRRRLVTPFDSWKRIAPSGFLVESRDAFLIAKSSSRPHVIAQEKGSDGVRLSPGKWKLEFRCAARMFENSFHGAVGEDLRTESQKWMLAGPHRLGFAKPISNEEYAARVRLAAEATEEKGTPRSRMSLPNREAKLVTGEVVDLEVPTDVRSNQLELEIVDR
jgi:hypothetical protein